MRLNRGRSQGLLSLSFSFFSIVFAFRSFTCGEQDERIEIGLRHSGCVSNQLIHDCWWWKFLLIIARKKRLKKGKDKEWTKRERYVCVCIRVCVCVRIYFRLFSPGISRKILRRVKTIFTASSIPRTVSANEGSFVSRLLSLFSFSLSLSFSQKWVGIDEKWAWERNSRSNYALILSSLPSDLVFFFFFFYCLYTTFPFGE